MKTSGKSCGKEYQNTVHTSSDDRTYLKEREEAVHGIHSELILERKRGKFLLAIHFVVPTTPKINWFPSHTQIIFVAAYLWRSYPTGARAQLISPLH